MTNKIFYTALNPITKACPEISNADSKFKILPLWEGTLFAYFETNRHPGTKKCNTDIEIVKEFYARKLLD